MTAQPGQRLGTCKKCQEHQPLERHHPLPRRHFGNSRCNNWTVDLCESCHKRADHLTYCLDAFIKAKDRKSMQADYETAFNDWLAVSDSRG